MVWWKPFRKDKVSTGLLPTTQRYITPYEELDACNKCLESKAICRHLPIFHKQLFITDNETVYQQALKKASIFRTFHLVYETVRFLMDGIYSFCPIWNNVLRLDEVTKQNRSIWATDTLYLHFKSPESYEKIIPFLGGGYSRLRLEGSLYFDQLKRLIHNNGIEKIFVGGKVILKTEEYDEFVALVMQHSRTFDSVFAMKPHYPNLEAKLVETFKEHPTHRFIPIPDLYWSVHHRDYTKYYLMVYFAFFLYYVVVHFWLCVSLWSAMPWAFVFTLPVVALNPMMTSFFQCAAVIY